MIVRCTYYKNLYVNLIFTGRRACELITVPISSRFLHINVWYNDWDVRLKVQGKYETSRIINNIEPFRPLKATEKRKNDICFCYLLRNSLGLTRVGSSDHRRDDMDAAIRFETWDDYLNSITAFLPFKIWRLTVLKLKKQDSRAIRTDNTPSKTRLLT